MSFIKLNRSCDWFVKQISIFLTKYFRSPDFFLGKHIRLLIILLMAVFASLFDDFL